MKKSGIILLFAVAALLAGCAKDNNLKAPKGDDPVIFTATIAQTRTALSIEGTAGKLVWEEGDEITINGVAYVATPDTENPAKATFSPKGTDEAEPISGMYYAVYNCTYNAEMFYGTLPANQTYAANSLAGVAPMYAESEDTELAFRNICSLLEVTLKGDAEISAISVSSSNLPMSGTFIFSDEGQTAMAISEENDIVTLACDGTQLTADGVSFYIAVPAGTYQNLKIKAVTTDGKAWSITAPNAAEIAVNKIYPLNFTPVFAADILLEGEFTINASGDKVKFVKGNLQYADGKYSFVQKQSQTGTLFSASEVEALEPETICGMEARLLSSTEWAYLLSHTNKVKLYTIGTRAGVLLIPNDADVTSDAAWSVLEENGAVFITSAGYAYGDSAACGVSEGGSYWTSDFKCLDFDACEIYADNVAPAAIRQAVRFVVDVE